MVQCAIYLQTTTQNVYGGLEKSQPTNWPTNAGLTQPNYSGLAGLFIFRPVIHIPRLQLAAFYASDYQLQTYKTLKKIKMSLSFENFETHLYMIRVWVKIIQTKWSNYSIFLHKAS